MLVRTVLLPQGLASQNMAWPRFPSNEAVIIKMASLVAEDKSKVMTSLDVW